MRRLAWFLGLLAACGGDVGLDYAGTPGTPVQALFVGNVPLVGAKVDGRDAVMLTDSGAPITILDSTAFPTAANGKRDIDLAALGLTFPGLGIVQYDLFGDATDTEDGIIGGDVLASFAFTVDYRGRRIWVDDPFTAADIPGDLTLEAEQVVEGELLGGGRATIPGVAGIVELRATRFVIPAQLEGRTEPVYLLVDTGASALVLDEAFLTSLGQTPPRPRLDGVNVGTVGGDTAAYFTRVWRLRLGAVDSDDLPVLVLPGTTLLQGLSAEVGRPIVGLVGGTVLRRYLTTLDYPGTKLRLARYTDQSHVAADEFVGPGFAVDVATGGQWRVSESYPGKDAYVDGLRVGDVIEEIGGTPIQGQSRAFVQNLLDGYQLGQDIPVGVRRATVIETLQVRVEDLLPSYPAP